MNIKLSEVTTILKDTIEEILQDRFEEINKHYSEVKCLSGKCKFNQMKNGFYGCELKEIRIGLNNPDLKNSNHENENHDCSNYEEDL